VESRPTYWLRQGIAAAKMGQKETARNLLMRVVEQDERNLTAWLWLADAVDSLDDKQVCLENVLTLDPENQAARKGLDWVREQRAAQSAYVPPLISDMPASSATPLTPAQAILRARAPEAEPPVVGPNPSRVSESPDAWVEAGPLPSQDKINAAANEFADETLCPYCASPTQLDDKKCPKCHGVLWKHSRKNPSGSVAFWFLLGTVLTGTLWGVYAFIVILTIRFGHMVASGQLTPEQFLGLYVGIRAVPPDVAETVLMGLPPQFFWAFAISMTVQFVQVVLLYLRWQPMYWFLVGLAILSILLAIGRLAINPSPQGGIGVGVSLLPLIFLFRIEDDFAVEHERYWCAPDKDIHSHSAFYQRGREYARKKMWAAAAVHFRRATAGSPTNVAYHLALVTAYAKLNRYERARSVLRDAQRLAPDNPDVRELGDLIATMRA
jgi:tetratricopeptide (TPR) repeat protein